MRGWVRSRGYEGQPAAGKASPHKTLGSVLKVETALVGHWIIGANERATLSKGAPRDMSPNCHVAYAVEILNCVDLDLELPLDPGAGASAHAYPPRVPTRPYPVHRGPQLHTSTWRI